MRQDEEEKHSKGSKEDHREPACLERGVVLFNETGNTLLGGRSSVDFCFEILLDIQIQMSVRSARNSKYFIRLYQIDFPMVQSPLTNWKL